MRRPICPSPPGKCIYVWSFFLVLRECSHKLAEALELSFSQKHQAANNWDADQQWVYDHYYNEGSKNMGYVNGMDTIWLSPGGTPTLCMDVAGGDIDDNGTPIQAWECYGGANQEWTFEYFP